MNEADSRISARKLRSTTKVEEDADSSRKSKYGNGEDAPIDFSLPAEEITLDLKQITKDWRDKSKAFLRENIPTVEPKKVRLENGHLVIGENERYTTSSRIVILSEYTQERFQGTITSVNTSELFVRLMDGSKAKIFLKHLRNHRVSIALSK